MPGRIGKYTYENKSVLKEFLSSLIKAMAGRKAKMMMRGIS